MEQPPERYPLSDAIVLAGATAGSYFVAFAYEAGYASAFSIPLDLIEVRVSSICIAAATLAVVAVQFTQLLAVFNPFNSRFGADDPLKHEIAHFTRLIFVCVLFVLVLGIRNLMLMSVAAAYFVLLASLTFLLPLITFRQVAGYREKLRASKEADRPALEANRRLLMPFGREKSLIFWAAMFLAALSWAAGYGRASSQGEFFVTATKPELVLLRSYGDKSVLAELHRSSSTVGPAYSVMPTGNVASIMLQRVGRLKAAEAAKK